MSGEQVYSYANLNLDVRVGSFGDAAVSNAPVVEDQDRIILDAREVSHLVFPSK